MSKKVTFSTIIEELAKQTGTTESLSHNFVSSLTDLVISSSIQSGKASITNFGSFSVVNVAARNGVNPQTGETIVIPSHQRLSFTPYKALESTVNAPYAHLEATVIEEGETPLNTFSKPTKEAGPKPEDNKKFTEEAPEEKIVDQVKFDDPFLNLEDKVDEKPSEETVSEPQELPELVDENEVEEIPFLGLDTSDKDPEETPEVENTDQDDDDPFRNLEEEPDKEPIEELPEVIDEIEVEEEPFPGLDTSDKDPEETPEVESSDQDDDDPFLNLKGALDKVDEKPNEATDSEPEVLPEVVDENEAEEVAIPEPETTDEEAEETSEVESSDQDEDDPFNNLEEEIDKEDDETDEDEKDEDDKETDRLITIPVILGIVLVLVVIVAGLWFFMFRDSAEPELAEQTPVETPIEESTSEDEETAPNQEQNSDPIPSLEEQAGEEIPTEAGTVETRPIVAQSHTVQRNDWFYDIARRTYVKPTFWPLIFEANFTVSQDPDIVLTGQNLEIPSIENAQNPTPNDRARVARAAKLVSEAYANAGKTEKANAYARMAIQYSN